MKKSLALLALLPLLACDSGGDAKPKSGTWAYDETELLNNDCGDSVPMYPDGDFSLTVSGAQFTVETPEETFTCSFDGGSYTCPERVVYDFTMGDTSAKILATIDGSIDSETNLSGTQTATISCTGSACSIAMSMFSITKLPCSYAISFTAAAK